MIRFPYVKCISCTNQVRKEPKCHSCLKKDIVNAYVEKLTTQYGPIDHDHAVLVHITGTGYRHTGYSCLTPEGFETVEIDHEVYFPAFASSISEFEKLMMLPQFKSKTVSTIEFTPTNFGSDTETEIETEFQIETDLFVSYITIDQRLSVWRDEGFYEGFYEKFPTMGYYINSLNLENINYSGICGCNRIFCDRDEPRIDRVQVVAMNPKIREMLTSFYSINNEPVDRLCP